MSRKTLAKHSVTVANNRLGGAGATKHQRLQTCKSFIIWSFQNGHVFNSMVDVHQEIVRAYLVACKAEGNDNSTLHNKLASIRRVMRSLGKDPDPIGITAKECGLSPRNRKGTKEPIPDAVFLAAVAKATEIGKHGLAIVLRLQRLLGHRGLESLMSIRALEKCALEASDFLNFEVVVSHGTKGGRYRQTEFIQARAKETLLVIRDSLIFAKDRHGYLIEGSKKDLKSGVARYHRLAAQVGLVGIYAPHSLRYAYCVEKLEEMRDAGLNKDEATKLAARFLGHGDSRARYVSMVYGKTVVHTLKPERRKKRIDRAIDTINSFIDTALVSSSIASSGLIM